MPQPVRLGVIGLGRRWRKRYRPALAALRDKFIVAGVYDQFAHRAERVAGELRCSPAPSLMALMERDDVDAILLLDSQWFGLWPLEAACRFGKPVFTAVSLEADDAHADRLFGQVFDSGLPVMVAMEPHFLPADARLRELLNGRLGAAHYLQCRMTIRHRQGDPSVADLAAPRPVYSLGSSGLSTLHWSASFLGGEPTEVHAIGGEHDQVSCLCFRFSNDRALQVTRFPVHRGHGGLRLDVTAEHGCAALRLPGRVTWSCGKDRHAHYLASCKTVGQILLERFHTAIREGHSLSPDLADAYRVLGWLRAAARSQTDGGWVAIS